MSRSLKLLGLSATLVMYLVLMAGALVTNSGSADGCGASWPLCKGSFLPGWDYHAVIEFSHRAVTGAAGLLVLGLSVLGWRALSGSRAARWMAGLSIFTLVLQSGLGAAAVIWPQPDAVLALHFGISLVCFAAVLLLTVLIFQGDSGRAGAGGSPAIEPLHPAFRNWVWSVTAFTYVVVYFGAYVRHLRATMACTGWPLCNGQLLPPLYGLTGIVFAHRIGAALLTLMVIRLALMARRTASKRRDLRNAAGLALGLILAQVASGAAFPLGHANIGTQELHSALIAAFWGAMSYLSLQVALAPTGVSREKPAA